MSSKRRTRSAPPEVRTTARSRPKTELPASKMLHPRAQESGSATPDAIVIDDDDPIPPSSLQVQPAHPPDPPPQSGTVASSGPPPRLPADLPLNIVRLIRGYQKANNCTAVPDEIYCIQTPRIFKIPTADNKNVRRVEYVYALTNEKLFVRAFRLEWMAKEVRGKASERLLVAHGGPLVEPIVLARTKRYSNEFRAWQGVHDDSTAPAVVIRKVLPVIEDDDTKIKLSPDRSVIVPVYGQGVLPRALNPGPEVVGGPWTAVEAAVLEKTTRTMFHFRSADGLRVRTAAQCPNIISLVTNAIAGGVITAHDRFPVLDCVITLTTTVQRRQIIADEQDFGDLVGLIMNHRSWKGPGDYCIIDVNRLTAAR